MVAERLGLRVRDALGNYIYGGHALRVSGARKFAAEGLDIGLIMLLARWSSNAVLRYIGEAPLQSLTQTYRAKLDSADWEQQLGTWRSELQEMKGSIQNLSSQMMMAVQDEVNLKVSGSYIPCSSDTGQFVRNDESGTVHARDPSDDGTSIPLTWRTRCGWWYGSTRFSRTSALPDCIAALLNC